MNKLRQTCAFRTRRAPRPISGNNERGAYSFHVVEVLDQDDNKHEITLPDNFDHSTLRPETMIVCDVDISVRKGYLSLNVVRGTLEIKSAPSPVAKAS